MKSRFLQSVIASGIPFGIGMGIYFSFRYGFPGGVIAGIASGIFFGLFMAIFAEKQRVRMGAKDGLFEGEDVIYEGPANHFRKAEACGGWLTLTNETLSFRSHGKNLQNQPVDLPLSQIASVEVSRTWGIVPNGFCVTNRDGVVNRFVVTGRAAWLRVVSAQVKG